MLSDYLSQYTYEHLIQDALKRVPNTVDKRIGSVIFDAVAPACYELAEYYMQLKYIIDNTFIATASGEYLDLRAGERGLSRYGATHAIAHGRFLTSTGEGIIIPIGTRFSSNEADSKIYTVRAEYKKDGNAVVGDYEMYCETPGSVGNDYMGQVLPLDYFNTSNQMAIAEIIDILIPARDAETDDELRLRLQETEQVLAFGGNIAQYVQAVTALEGVGGVQVYPHWNGGGSVKCSIVDVNNMPCTDAIISAVQEAVDPDPQSEGLGIAPIGHKVTVVTPTEKTVDFEVTLSIPNPGPYQEKVTAAINTYLAELRMRWAKPADKYNNYNTTIYNSQAVTAISNAIASSQISVAVNIDKQGPGVDLVLCENSTTQELPVSRAIDLRGTS